MTISSKERLFIDIETYCDKDLAKCGVYAYAASPSFEVTLIGTAGDDGGVRVYDLVRSVCVSFAADAPPDDFGEETALDLAEFRAALVSPDVLKIAHNAQFEMACLSSFFRFEAEPEQWLDTMALANMAGLPASLAALSDVLALGEKGKKSIGRQLIQTFAKPDKNGRRTTADDKPAAWLEFIKYNRYDVEAERLIYKRLAPFVAVTPQERELFCLDYRINRRGIRIDVPFVKSAAALSQDVTAPVMEQLATLTGLENPNSVAALKGWLNTHGLNVDKLTKDKAESLINETNDPAVKKALQLKFSVAKAAVKKYDTMLRAECDGRIKGAFQYYGASRSGRWAGRLVQLQNLRRNSIPDIDTARELVKARDLEGLCLAYDIPGLDVPEILGQLVRTAFIPSKGRKFIVADFSAIEARVVAWLAGEKWRNDVFRNDGDIYKSSYSQAFDVPVADVTKDMRQKGKIMELALGYGGSVGALKAFGADKLGLSDDELKELVESWRAASPKIVLLWRRCESCARAAINKGRTSSIKITDDIALNFDREELCGYNVMTIGLPSGRFLCYQNAALVDTNFGESITYMDIKQNTRNYERTQTHGGKLVENITQAVARDCLADAMLRLERRGYEIVAHVHDEVIIDAPRDASVEEVERIMGEASPVYPGLHLSAHGYEGNYYFKD